MRLIDRGATYQLRLPTLELREREIMNMYRSNPGRSRPLKVVPMRKPDIPQCLPKELGQVVGTSHRYFPSSASQ